MKLLRITTVPISLQLLLTGQFKYMVQNGFEVYTVSADGPEVAEVLKEGVRHIAIPFTRKITPWQDLRCLIALVKVIKKIRPDIIHTHTPKAGLLGMMAGRICNVPVRMHTVAGLPLMEATGMRRRLLETMEKLTYTCAQYIYPNSSGLEKFITKELGVSRDKVKIIGKGSSNGINTQLFSRTVSLDEQAQALRRQYNVGAGDVLFSFVGRVVKDKGVVELVQAFRNVSQKLEADGRRVFLLVVGSFEQELDPLPDDVMTFLRSNKYVILAGFQKDVRPWLVASDVFVFPSYREGFPNVVMQAALLRVASIVSDINGCNEIIERNVSGIVVQPKDAASLSEAMIALAANKSLRDQLAGKAYEFVVSNYSREFVWGEIEREYLRLLKGSRGGKGAGILPQRRKGATDRGE